MVEEKDDTKHENISAKEFLNNLQTDLTEMYTQELDEHGLKSIDLAIDILEVMKQSEATDTLTYHAVLLTLARINYDNFESVSELMRYLSNGFVRNLDSWNVKIWLFWKGGVKMDEKGVSEISGSEKFVVNEEVNATTGERTYSISGKRTVEYEWFRVGKYRTRKEAEAKAAQL
jgi:hypothetical protein